MPEPLRTCVGCRSKGPQSGLVRFVRTTAGWELDRGRVRSAGRGTYLCSGACAARVVKNKRFPGLAAAAGTVAWEGRTSLGEASIARV